MKITDAQFVLGAVAMAQVPEDGMPQIAFVGRSNVGKSSLQNALLGRKGLVKVSGTPGKTREINFFKINQAFYFADLPGIGYAKISMTKREVIGKLISTYLEKAKDIRGVVYLVDLRTGGTDMDIQAVKFIKDLGLPHLIVGTKMDKLNQSELHKALREITERFELDQAPIPVSSSTKKNLDLLWDQLVEAISA